MGFIEKQADVLLKDALSVNATDIHLTPRQEDAIIQFRIQQRLFMKEKIPIQIFEKLISHFKFLAGMDIGEKRRPQNGSIQLEMNGTNVSLRLSTLPLFHHESMVIRLLPQSSTLPLQQLSLFPSSLQTLFSLSLHTSGLILLTGPTGSGKTTTLYALLQAIQRYWDCNIITLEDPIEKRMNTGCLQVQVNEKAGITYATGLKAILRHDPDVIMVGEIRDEETAKAAVRASLTGHLVLSTLHAHSTRTAINRLKDLGISIQDIEQTLICVTAQRLVNLKCPFCNGPCSSYCLQRRKISRLSVYEILHGENLQEVMKEVKGEEASYYYKTIADLIQKGIALGYISADYEGGWS